MKFYTMPDSLPGEIQKFEQDIEDYGKGEINPVQFKGIRVAHGIYEQRKLATHMIRIRCPAGAATPRQLAKVAALSKRYGAPEFHLTTRTDVQLHYIDLDDVISVYQELVSVDLSSRGGGGNTIRNIMASHDSGINPDEPFDVAPYATALTTRLIAESDSWNLPRKFKIAFSNTDDDTANVTITCLGFIAKKKDGKKGFKVYVGGGMGSKPMLGQVLYEFVPEGRVYYIARAIKTLFDRLGDRRRKYQSRFKFLVEKLGVDEIRKIVEEEVEKLGPGLELKVDRIENKAPEDIDVPVETVDSPDYESWKKRYVRPQKQEGLITIKVPLHLGDIKNEDGITLGKFLEPFGDNTIRFSLDQNLHLRNIPKEYAGNIYNQLLKMETLSTQPVIISNMIACTGADTCKLGICLPRGLVPTIADTLLDSNLDLDALADVKIHVSGCPNTCGRHHVADLGFFGKIMRQGGEMLPAYNIMAGAVVRDGETRFAYKLDDIAAKDTPAFVLDLLSTYVSKKDQYRNFSDYVNNGGRADIQQLAKQHRQLPTLQENEKYYYDWGTKNKFSLLKGQKAECCAGVFDMINVDKKAIEAARKVVETSTESKEVDEALYNMVFCSSRMLLVTRGIEVRRDEQVFEMFAQHFIESNLVSSVFKGIVLAAKAKDHEALRSARQKVFDLGETVANLYKSMDDSLRFKVEPTCEPKKDDNTPGFSGVSEPSKSGKTNGADTFKDFRGVGCPMNFVKTKLALEPMEVGKVLEILLDDGEPIENVPNSVALDGHTILNKEKQPEGHWSVVIRKA